MLYDKTWHYHEKGKETMTCEKSLDEVSVEQMLKGIEIKDEIQRKVKEKKEMEKSLMQWDVFISYS